MSEQQPPPPSGGPRDDSPDGVFYGTSGDDRRLLPDLSPLEWLVFAALAAALAAANIYTTLLIGWGDTGSIIAVLAAVGVLGAFRRRAGVQVLNLGQTLASAGGSIGFAVASYAAVYIVRPEFDPPAWALVLMFTAMGLFGAVVGSSVRRSMVGYFFPSGTACAVIQTSVARESRPGETNRSVRLLTLWGSVAGLLTLPTKISLREDARAILPEWTWNEDKGVGLGVDPLYYGIGIVVGPRIGIGMLLGALASPFLIVDRLAGTDLASEAGDWVKWIAIALLTLPTFATILYAYFFRTPPVVPPGFTPGRTTYAVPAARPLLYGLVGVLGAVGVAATAQVVFGLPWPASLVVMLVAWPLCIMNGRVTGDTDINPVRLVAIVILSAFFWMVDDSGGAIVMLGMAVVGGTLASVAVDMMQDYRTGYLVDANPTHQTVVQFVGVAIGALASVPVLGLLLERLGVGPGSSLPAPGAQVWAAMAEAMVGGFHPSTPLIWAIVLASALGSLYAYLTVWPRTAPWMPSIFGMGIGMLVGVPASMAIFGGGLIKWVATRGYLRGRTGAARVEALHDAGNDTMLVGASVFAAGALLSIVLVLLVTALEALGLPAFQIAH